MILAIETGISCGSLSLLRDGSEVDFWIGKEKVLTSEDLLSNIAALLSKSGINKIEIKKIAVSTGPGSFTGIRVGIATATGLSKALRCECFGIPVLEAMTLKLQFTGEVVTAFGLGENEICWQIFKADKLNQIQCINYPKIGVVKVFEAELKKYSRKILILSGDLHKKFRQKDHLIDTRDFEQIEIIENPAKYVGLRSEEITLTSKLLPLYAKDTGIS